MTRTLQLFLLSLILLFGTTATKCIHSCFAQDGVQKKTVVVAQNGSGDIKGNSDADIVAAIKRVVEAGGGTVKIRKGIYNIHQSIRLGPEVKNVAIEGEEDTVLRLTPQLRTVTTSEAGSGGTVLKVSDASGFRPGMFIEIKASGKTDSFSGHRQNFFCMTVLSASGREIQFTKPVDYPVPAGTIILCLVNVFQIDRAKGVSIRKIIIDGDAKEGDIPPLNHTYHCGVFGAGPYSYEKGPLGEPVEDLLIENCVIRNFLHRGIALYSAKHAQVIHCVFENTHAEAIDFDHFNYHCVAKGNTITAATVAIELNDASYCTVEENAIKDCDIGVNIWRWCRLDNLNVENKVLKNSILNTKKSGVHCAKGADRNLIEGNVIKGGKGVGITIEGNDNVTSGNVVSDMGKEAMVVRGTGNKTENNTTTGEVK